MKNPFETTLSDLSDALDFDPETGLLRWLETHGRVTAGDLAGSLHRDGGMVVSFHGTTYQAHHLAWFLHHHEWPASQVLFRDKDPMNLRPANLYSRAEAYRTSPGVRRRMQTYRERIKDRKHAARLKSDVYGVALGYDKKTWTVRAPWRFDLVLASFLDRADAEAYALGAAAGHDYIEANPVPTLPAKEKTIHAGTGQAVTLYDAHQALAYDPAIGAIYYRRTHTPAVELDASHRVIVRLKGRVYMAGMMAWFLSTGQWPKRKQLAYRDGNPKHTALANLYLKDAK